MTIANDKLQELEDVIGVAMDSMAKGFSERNVEYCDGYYIVFEDGSSISVALTVQESE